MSEGVAELRLPRLLPHQAEVRDRPEGVKVLRWGRRTGKSRTMLWLSVLGHGEGEGTERKYRGLLNGLDVAWLAPNFKQAKIIWDEEVWPRFHGLGELNEQEMTCTVPGHGTLYVRSGHTRDAIDALRGMGARLGGVVVDEAAALDLEYALKDVILPMRMDRGAWLLMGSTPKAGSYFNEVCRQVEAGLRPGWWHSHRVPWDNPALQAERIEELVAEYAEDSPAVRQEVHAELLEGGAGLAFPEFSREVHVRGEEPERWAGREVRWWAGVDWGYDAPGAVVLLAAVGGRMVVRWEYYHRQQTPYEVGYVCGQRWRGIAMPEWVAFDPSMAAVRDGGPTVEELWGKGLRDGCQGGVVPVLVPAPVGKGVRVAGKQLIHEGLRYERGEDGKVLAWRAPRLVIHPSCGNLVRELAMLALDPRNPEDVDTRGSDHAYDALRYSLLSREPVVGRGAREVGEDRHPGTLPDGTRRARVRTWEVEVREAMVEAAARGESVGSRYGYRPGVMERE